MRFLAPGFLAFTALFALPLLVHLIGKRRARPRAFAAIELLLRSERRVARRTRIHNWLLLLVRALAIAAVPLILAKPFLERSSGDVAVVAAAGAQSAVIILDDSLSMTAVTAGRPLLATAKLRARHIVDALGGDAEAALLLGSRDATAPVGQLTADRARLSRAIDEVQPTFRSTDLSGALKRAAQLLASASRPERRVYLISDFAAHGFTDATPWAAGQGPTLIPVDVTQGRPVANHAVVDLHTDPAPQLGPRAVRVSVTVANFAPTPLSGLSVTLLVDGRAVAKGLVDLPAQGQAVKRFFHVFAKEAGEAELGVHDLVAELPADALSADDRRYARVEVHRDLRVLLVDGDPRTTRQADELFFVQAALRPGDSDDAQLELTTVTADELAGRRLADFDVVYLCNVKSPDGEQLRDYVRQGGGLFLALGDNVDPDAWNAALGDLLPRPLQAIRTVGLAGAATGRTGEGQHLQPPAHDLPLLAPLAEAREALPAARFSRYALFSPLAQPRGRVLLQFADGAPALLESRYGEGRVLLFASTLDRDWNDLPLQPIFLPLLQQATRYLARAPLREPEAPRLVGQAQRLPLLAGDQRVEVTAPSGRTRAFLREQVAGRPFFSFRETDDPGRYRVAIAGRDGVLRPRRDATFVVNLDPAESDPTPLQLKRLQPLTRSGGTTTGGRHQVALWHQLGAALLLLLLGEALLLRRK